MSRGFPEVGFICSYWGFSEKDDPKQKPCVDLTASIWFSCIAWPMYHEALQEKVSGLDSEVCNCIKT